MKKLLALILCVMMFVSVLSTSAFANNTVVRTTNLPGITNRPLTPALTTASMIAANKAISNAKANIEYLYGTLVADNTVFGTIKSIDSIVNDLAKGMYADMDGTFRGLSASKLESNTKTVLKDLIGSEIIRYMNDHRNDYTSTSTTLTVGTANGAKLTFTGKTNPNGAYLYTDPNGVVYAASPNGVDAQGRPVYNWQTTTATLAQAIATVGAWAPATVVQTNELSYDPLKYAQAFGAAANEAFNSGEAAANLQNIMYQMYSAKVLSDVNDELDDLAKEIRVWENGSTVLDDYHFNEALFFPYAFMNEFDTPNTIGEGIDPIIFAP